VLVFFRLSTGRGGDRDRPRGRGEGLRIQGSDVRLRAARIGPVLERAPDRDAEEERRDEAEEGNRRPDERARLAAAGRAAVDAHGS
jgi:hypothetical protein